VFTLGRRLPSPEFQRVRERLDAGRSLVERDEKRALRRVK